MFSLLPELQKRNLDKEYSFRKYYFMLSFAAITLIAALVLILPSYIRTKLALDAAQTRKDQLQAMVGTENQVSTDALHELKAETSALSISSSTPFSGILANIIADAPAGVHIKEFQYNQGAAEPAIVSGIAGTRDELLTFSDALKADKQFSNVDLPVESLAADKDASFTIRLTLATPTSPTP